LQFFDEAFVRTDVPPPSSTPTLFDVRRRGFTFVRAGAVLTGSYVYEPTTDGIYPMLLFVYPCWIYPCSTIGWDLLSTTMAAQGFVVVAFSPQRGADLESDMDDALTLIAHIKAGHLSTKGDANRLALSGGSLTSIHVWRVAQLARPDTLRAIVVLGGISDVFLIRQRFESHELLLEPPFDVPLSTALLGLGRPNLNPDLYVRYSPVYHLDALPRVPIALIHGGGDKTVPFEQSPHFSQWLNARSIAHELYLYPKQEHYLDLENINADERDMLEKVVGFLQRALR
ncbi:MAG: S9 family peptidase, partial [Chloroflexi bacterium]|nr:S9 family peptidase [Chloroflexota bacterium]